MKALLYISIPSALLLSPVTASADVVESNVYFYCNSEAGTVNVQYPSPGSDPLLLHPPGAPAQLHDLRTIPIEKELIERAGDGWKEKPLILTCGSGPKALTIELAGRSYNMANANGMGGQRFMLR